MRFRLVRFPAAILGACLVAALLPVTAGAQETPEIRLELVSQPVWHEADDRLGLRIRIVNEGPGDLEGFDLVVAAFNRVTTRSELRTIFDSGSLGTIPSSQLPLPLAVNRVLGAGQSMIIEVRNPVADLASIEDAGESGVFPIQVTMRNLSATPQAAVITPLLFYPDSIDARLNVVPIITLDDAPARGPGATFAPVVIDGEERWPLEEALAEDGWITALLDAMEARAGKLHAGFAPTPRLIEEIADMADGFPRLSGGEIEEVGESDPVPRAAADAIERVRALLQNPNLQHLLAPYSAPDLPSIATEPNAVLNQINVGEAVMEEVVGNVEPEWVFPTGARVDETTFEQLASARMVFSSDSLDAPSDPALAGCPEEEFSWLCPVEVRTSQTPSRTGFVLDASLQERLGELADPGNERLELQQFFAETAMIREELPGRTDRVLAFALPQSWRPNAGTARTLINGLTSARWLATHTPSAGIEGQDLFKERRVRNQLDVPLDQPTVPSLDIVASALERVEQFRAVNPPDELAERLHRDVLVAQSRWWWTDPERGPERGIAYASEAAEKVDSEFAKIRIVGPDEITLTSRTGELQFLIVNETGYTVRAGVELVSAQLDLNEREPYEISTAQQRLNVPVTTRSSGIFRLTVRLVTPEGVPIGEAEQIRVRSTDFNEIALGLTFGALAFLILFYAVRGVRRNRRSGGEAGASQA